MEDAYTHSYYVEINGYQVWPLSTPIIAALVGAILLMIAVGIVLTLYGTCRNKRTKNR